MKLGCIIVIQLWDCSSFVSSPSWVFNNDNDNADNCANNCANNCAKNVNDDSAFRRAVFGVVGSFWNEVLPTCGTKCRMHFSDVKKTSVFLCLWFIRRGGVTCDSKKYLLSLNTIHRGYLDW